jgi:riboflavin kinase/FMN adenylyltransferase
VRILRSPGELPENMSDLCITVGNFDGVHLGHRAVLSELISSGMKDDRTSVAATFVPHPLAVIAPERAPELLSPEREREELLALSGIDALLAIEFTPELAQMTALDFLVWLGIGRGAHLVLGYDFHMGHDRACGLERFGELGKEMGYGFDVVPPVLHDEIPISSTRIRESLGRGNVVAAGRMLGREYRLAGEVVAGDGIGARRFGTPTANVHLPERKLLPADGVYLVRVSSIEGAFGLMYIGRRPTFGKTERRVEVHIFDVDVDLYGGRLVVDLLKRLRGDRRFDGEEALAKQILLDVAEGRALAGEL